MSLKMYHYLAPIGSCEELSMIGSSSVAGRWRGLCPYLKKPVGLLVNRGKVQIEMQLISKHK